MAIADGLQPIRVDKKTKTIPNLIFQIEQYERFLIQLTKKTKVNFTKYCKRSTTRDFRISVEFLQQYDEADADSDQENLKVVPTRLAAHAQKNEYDDEEDDEPNKRVKV